MNREVKSVINKKGFVRKLLEEKSLFCTPTLFQISVGLQSMILLNNLVYN